MAESGRKKGADSSIVRICFGGRCGLPAFSDAINASSRAGGGNGAAAAFADLFKNECVKNAGCQKMPAFLIT